MSELLQNPFGWIYEHPKEKILFYTTCIFEDIKKYGNVKLWWEKNEALYKGRNYGNDLYEVKQGAQHFWKRITPINPTSIDLQEIEQPSENKNKDDMSIDSIQNTTNHIKTNNTDIDDISMDLTDNTDEDIHEILEFARNETNN